MGQWIVNFLIALLLNILWRPEGLMMTGLLTILHFAFGLPMKFVWISLAVYFIYIIFWVGFFTVLSRVRFKPRHYDQSVTLHPNRNAEYDAMYRQGSGISTRHQPGQAAPETPADIGSLVEEALAEKKADTTATTDIDTTKE